MSRRSRRLILVAILLLAASMRIVSIRSSAPQDDAYITYRYAVNLAAGRGFVYNPGERVLGTTTPLFALLLAPLARAGAPVDAVALVLGVLADLATCVLLCRWLASSHDEASGYLAALFYATFYASVAASGYGMETQVFVLLLVAALSSFTAGRHGLAAIATALAAVTRPEGLLLAGILCVALWRGRRRSLPLKPMALALLLVGSWTLFASGYFGSPVPNSLLAKASGQGIGASEWVRFFFARNPVVLLLWGGFLAGCVVAWRARSRALGLLAAWAVVYSLFFLAGRPVFLGAWYFPPAALSLLALSAAAAATLARRMVASPGRRFLAVGLPWLAAMLWLVPRNLEAGRWTKTSADTVYRPMARWLRDQTSSDDVLFVGDIGYVGYISGRKILDAAGLVSPAVWRYYRGNPSDPLKDVHFVLQHRPDMVVLPMRPGLYPHWTGSEFLDHYRPVRRFQAFGDTELQPREDPALRYQRDFDRAVADYIVYELTGEP